MNVNKKLGRFKQWAGERMGGEAKTSVSDDFKSLEIEMGLRQDGWQPSYSMNVIFLDDAKNHCRNGTPPANYDCICQNPLKAPGRG